MLTPVREDDVWLIQMSDLNKLDGPEYEARVHTISGSHVRPLGKNGQTWVDTTTGTIYRSNGVCMSGAPYLMEEPYLTGRDIPSNKIRQAEARARFLNSQATGDSDAD